MSSKDLGKTGEDIACRYLKKQNYQIIERNFFYNGGEIDIIAFDIEKNELVFFEVKTRSNKAYGLPSEAVDNFKIKRILRGAKFYMHIHSLENVFVRFDVLELFFVNDRYLVNHLKQILWNNIDVLD